MAAWRRTWQPGAIDRIVADLWGSNRIYPVMQSALGKDRSARPLFGMLDQRHGVFRNFSA